MHKRLPGCMGEAQEGVISWFKSSEVSVERYFLFSALALVVTFAWMEPAGAAGLGFLKGLVFWTVQLSILIPLLISIQQLVSHHITLRGPRAPWILTALSGVVGAFLFVPIAYFLDAVFGLPENGAPLGLVRALLDEASGVVVPVTVTWVALNAPWILQLDFSARRGEVVPQELDHDGNPPSEETEQPTPFLQELRSRTEGDLISISSELHYVRVVTTTREVMFLYNLRDAIDQLPVGAGVQIHRSHWVSRDHIEEVIKTNGALECLLSNGRRLPVSRRKYGELKEFLALRLESLAT